MKLLIATTNRHKVHEISHILAEYGVEVSQLDIEAQEPDLGSLEKIAEHKARQAYSNARRPLIAEDTGIYFDAYDDFPGVFAKRVFLGIGFRGLLALIRAADSKAARFRTAICYYDGRAAKVFSGELKGRLLEHLVSEEKDRLPYEKLFVPDGHSKALVELPHGEKNRISHRAQAARKLGEWLAQRK
ncbi:MAG: non-canonical purine NTP pyrophosphatase [Candidatus Diapherotrites archaeon]|uniref:Non-canonical purine NTP pyrophosphatase n=1 Tax=Candidatus Iainarchaeum sp. TaxID=3101447 RepID=A0A8T3YMP2_9ARCH|nr:non-canonical purine NTP pyrophosphatase [Candidatus Diapherotrites archaeon]